MSQALSIHAGPGRIGLTLRGWLIEPVASLHGPTPRRQARLLAALILCQMLLFISLAAGYLLGVPGYSLPAAHKSGFLVWLGLYVLSRLGRTRLAVALLLPIYPLMAIMTVARGAALDVSGTLAYLIPSFVFASVFLSPVGTAIYGLGAALLALLLPLIAPARVPDLTTVLGPVGAGVIAVALTIIAMLNRDRIERDHQADLKRAYDSTLEGWARALEIRDRATEGHSRRVTTLATRLARRCGLRGEDLEAVYRGALLHDIGKLALPDTILSKDTQLTEAEEQIMHSHPRIAQDLLSNIAFLRPSLVIPACHHERWDGSGYPYGLRGEEIPLTARIFAVVDAWDALLSDRPYRKAWSREQAVRHLKSQSGIQFDPQIVKRFLDVIS